MTPSVKFFWIRHWSDLENFENSKWQIQYGGQKILFFIKSCPRCVFVGFWGHWLRIWNSILKMLKFQNGGSNISLFINKLVYSRNNKVAVFSIIVVSFFHNVRRKWKWRTLGTLFNSNTTSLYLYYYINKHTHISTNSQILYSSTIYAFYIGMNLNDRNNGLGAVIQSTITNWAFACAFYYY